MDHMKRALELAAAAAGGVGPRPPVGALVVKNGEVVGEGYTAPSPGPHAEVVALEKAGEAARGATIYVTLEPCSHQGATPPCADALIAAGVARVVVAARDPNPLVDGAGIGRLAAAGIALDEDIAEEDRAAALELLEGFAHHVRTGVPLVTAKYAMSLDGKIATRAGDSQWITGEAARERAHMMRARSDAVMVGVGTVLADDPRLSARPGGEPPSEPRPRLRVIVDSGGRVRPAARVFWEPGAVLLVHSVRSEDAGPLIGFPDNVEMLELPAGYGGVDLHALCDELGRRGCTSLLVEGGGTLLGSMMDLGLVDRVAAFIAPVVVGGADAPGPVGGGGVEKLVDATRLERVRVEQLEEDLLLTGYVPGRVAHPPNSRKRSVRRDLTT